MAMSATQKLNAFLEDDLPASNLNHNLRDIEQEFNIYEKTYQKSENLKKLEKALMTMKQVVLNQNGFLVVLVALSLSSEHVLVMTI